MTAFCGALLALCGAALGCLFLASGADGLLPAAGGLEFLGPWAGTRSLGGAGLALYLIGVGLLGNLLRRDGRRARLEGLLLGACGLGVGFAVSLVLCVRGGLDLRIVGAILLGLACQSVIALGLTLKLAISGGPRRLLFVPGVILTLALLVFELLVVALGAA